MTMNSQKKIEVNQSSLLSLKAELLRKKQEVHDAKLSDFPNRPTVVAKLKTKLDKANEGVDERNKKDAEETEEEKNVLRKSQSILEAKSKLYDELSKDPHKGKGSNLFLVDFKGKEQISKAEEVETDEDEDDKIESDYDDDEEWVDFVDCLGRTKRCHRDDLESMKANDENLRRTLFGSAESRKQEEEKNKPEAQDLPETLKEPDLCSEDMRREMLRQKWEEEERKLLDRKDIHYQHVLFDEARSHGVGYYSFSTDEAERTRQLEELKNLRKETLQQQAVTQEAAQRKKKQMEERLRAARRRKRERLGLPPEEETEEAVEEEEKKPEKPEELKREEQHPTTIRPWDVGKDNVSRILSQEEWIEKRRDERPEEFAPPRIPSTGQKAPQRKRRKEESMERSLPEGYLQDVRSYSRKAPVERVSPVKEDPPERRGVGAEIPPPPIFELYGPSSKTKKASSNVSDIEKSIEEGLNFIRKQVEEKQSQKEKGFIEFL